MNENEITTEMGRIYWRFWHAGLRGLLGWSDERISQWAERFRHPLNDAHSPLFNYTAANIMAQVLIADELRQRISNEGRLDLEKKIEDALNKPDAFPEEAKNYDWQSARERIQRILREYGNNLPEA